MALLSFPAAAPAQQLSGLGTRYQIPASPAGDTQVSPEIDLNEIGVDQRLNQFMALDAAVREPGGEPRPLREFLGGRPSVVAFVYQRCPMLCAISQDYLLRSLRAISLDVGEDFNALLIGLDPDEDPELTRAAREKYIQAYNRPGSEKGWRYLNAAPPAIEALTQSAGYRYVYDPSSGQYAHAAVWIVLTPEGRISRYIFGVDAPPRDLKLALTEAGRGSIGSLADAALLYCYQFNAATGRYTPAITRLVRAGGLATLVGLIGMIWALRRKSKNANTDRAPACAEMSPTGARPDES